MSSESFDPNEIEKTRQQIRDLVNKISFLAKQQPAPDDFFSTFLNHVVEALAAVGGAVWLQGEDGVLQLQHQVRLRETELMNTPETQQQHGQLLHSVIRQNEAMLMPPHSGGDADMAGNPSQYLLVLCPTKNEDHEPLGVVEIFQRPTAGPTTQRGYLRFLAQMCDIASDYLKTRKLREFSDRQAMWSRLETFTRQAHSTLHPREAAFTIANEGRRLIECDRVSLGIARGKKCKIEAISGQDVFDNRSNTVRLLNNLATAVIATGEPMWYSGDTTDLAPQVEKALQAYVDDSHSKSIGVLPLLRPLDESEEHAEKEDRQSQEPPLGALIIEQIEDSTQHEGMMRRVNVVAEHSALALANALDHHGLFLMPVWRTLGNATFILKARMLPKTLAVLAVIAVLAACLLLIPYDFDLEGRGTLEPQDRRDVFAGIDGVVMDVEVHHGDFVSDGQLLANMRNVDMEVALTSLEGQRAEALERFNSTHSMLLGENKLTPVDQNRLRGEMSQLKQNLASLKSQIDLQLAKSKQLEIHSPMAGQVITWDVHDRLIHRPVQRGQMLMTVANGEGPWQLEVRMPEDRMGYITRSNRAFTDNQRVTFILATDPGTSYQGVVREIHYTAEVRGEEGNTVLIKVDFDKSQLEELLRPGATVIAKVHCGRESLGFVLFHDVYEFIQSRILFRL